METINYFWGVVFDSMIRALCLLLAITLVLIIWQMMERWFKLRKDVLKYRKGYRNAIQDAVNNVNELFDDWNADDPLSDIPSQKTIIARLENLTYVNKRNIPRE